MPNNAFTLIAHRGFSSDAPENTFDAFELALEHGFNNIETDVQITSDGRLVLIHDDLLDRTTDGKGAVAESSIAHVNSLDAGLWFDAPKDGVGKTGPAAYGDTFVPTLEDFLERFHGKVNLHLELKSHEAELSEKVAAALSEFNWKRPRSAKSAGVSISSFDFAQLKRSRLAMPKLDHGFLLRKITEADCEAAREIGCTGIYPNASTVETTDVELAEKYDLFVRAWGVKTEEDLKRAFDSGAAGTTVDWPLKAKQLLGI